MKNLARFKEKVNARNIMVQAMYQLSFGHNTAKEIEDSFVKEFTKTKVDYIFFKNIFKYTVKNNDALKEQIYSKSDLELFGIKKIDVMEENILMLILSEYELDQTPKNILIDEAVRLSKKFGADNAYKFVNATLDTLLK
ncbi:MAG: DUF1948 domain-containing protein [Proteobacteria bacterium]|mgnify:FL=1|nr:DUF1948 domain-containing protein [Pseudomonadota bacterium]